MGFLVSALLQYASFLSYVLLRKRYVGDIGLEPVDPMPGNQGKRALTKILSVTVALLGILAALVATGVVSANSFMNMVSTVCIFVPIVYFIIIITSKKVTGDEAGRVKGDLLTMDFGATYEGYGSDITRTVVLGRPSDDQKKIYEVVKEAKKRAQDTLRAGTAVNEVAAAGVGWIEKCGYTVPHGIGHSFGFDSHEDLFISSRDDSKLGVNMVTTLEPGIYIPGVEGVRLEDDYLIQFDGAEQLTHCRYGLLIEGRLCRPGRTMLLLKTNHKRFILFPLVYLYHTGGRFRGKQRMEKNFSTKKK